MFVFPQVEDHFISSTSDNTSSITQVLTIKLNTTLDPEVHNEACVLSTVGHLYWGDPQCQIASVQVFTSDCCIHLCIMRLLLVSIGVDDHTRVGSWPVHGKRRQVDRGNHIKQEDDIITFLCFNFRNWANGSMFFWGETTQLEYLWIKVTISYLKTAAVSAEYCSWTRSILEHRSYVLSQRIISEFAQVTHTKWLFLKTTSEKPALLMPYWYPRAKQLTKCK